MVVPLAPIPQIQGQQTWDPADYSGVAFDWTKLRFMPSSLYETGENYREQCGEHGWEVQRTFLCNWSDVADAIQWFYGYSFLIEQQQVNSLECIGPDGLLPDGSQPQDPPADDTPVQGHMSRVIPAQDWYRPYLYADHVELVEGIGVPLQDPGLFLENILGEDLTNVPVLTGSVPTVGVGPPPTGTSNVYHWEGLLAVFNDAGLGANQFTVFAQVDWGDGTNGPGIVQYEGVPGSFAVSGQHDFKTAGPWNATVTITGPPPKSVTLTQKVQVGGQPNRMLGGGINLPDPKGRHRLPGLVFAECRGPTPMPLDGTLSGEFLDGVAKLRVTYRPKPYIVRNDAQNAAWESGELGRYVERRPTYAIQGVGLGNVSRSGPNQLKFVASAPPGVAGQLIPEAGILIVPTAAWSYIWYDVPFYPSQAISNCMGRVNAATFDGIAGFPAFPAGTLLCQAPDIQQGRNACGSPSFTIYWKLDYREQGWNVFPAGDGKFWPATWGGGDPLPDGSNLVFKSADFNQLFAVGLTFPYG